MTTDVNDPRLDLIYRAYDNYRQAVNDVDEIISGYTDRIMRPGNGTPRLDAQTRDLIGRAARGATELSNLLTAVYRDSNCAVAAGAGKIDDLPIEALRVKFNEAVGAVEVDTVGGPVDLMTECLIAKAREQEAWNEFLAQEV